MFGMGMGELLLILVVALLVIGPDKLPQAAKTIGKGIRDFRRHSKDLQSTLEQDEKLGEAVRELRSALRDDPLRWTAPRTPPSPATGAASTGSATETAESTDTGVPAIRPAPGTIAKETQGTSPGPASEGAPADVESAKPKADDSAHG